MAKKIIIYFILDMDLEENEDKSDFYKDGDTYHEVDLDKVKAHPAVEQTNMEDFFHNLNTEQVDTYGVFAFEEVEVKDERDYLPRGKRYRITKNLDDHPGYKGEELRITAFDVINDLYELVNTKGETFGASEDELTLSDRKPGQIINWGDHH